MQNFAGFVKQVKQIEVSNLHPEEVNGAKMGSSIIPMTKLTVLSADSAAGNGKVAMRSNKAVQTCNPYWDMQHMQWEEEEYLEKWGRDQHVSLVIADEGRGPPCHVQIDFDVSTLVFLGRIDVRQIFLPLNSLFLHDDDGLWVTMETIQSVPQFEPEVATARRVVETDRKEEINDLEGAISEDTAIDEIEGVEKLRELSAKHKEARKGTKGSNIVLKKELEEWKKKVEAMEAEADEEERIMKREAEALSEVADVKGAISLCGKFTDEVKELERQVKEIIDSGMKTKFLLEARQLKLVGELQTIYPIEPVRSTGKYAIRGLELPAFDCSAREEEHLTTALGYLVHLLLLLSKYLDVPLRYQLLYFSSRSLVKDAVSGISVPLYRKDIEPEKFKKAIVWLQRDVEQLLNSRGLVFDERRNILAETNRLFLDLISL